MVETASTDTTISIPALLHLYERLLELPEPVLDLSTETQTLETLLDVGKELEHLAPKLVPIVCQLVLRELGRIPPEDRNTWLRRILPLAPPEDDALVRALLERVSATQVLSWILAIRDKETEKTVKRLQSLFHAVSYQGAIELVDTLGELDKESIELVKEALPVLRTKIVVVTRPQCADADPDYAACLLKRLSFVGGKQTVPLVAQLLNRLDPGDAAMLELGLTTLAAASDRSMAPTFAFYQDSDTPSIRLLAARILVRLGGSSSIEFVEKQLHKKTIDLEEKKAILTEAARMGTEEVRQLLKRFVRPLLFSRNAKELRRHAAALLGGDHAD